MKRLAIISLIVFGFFACSINQSKTSEESKISDKALSTETDSVAFTLGHSYGSNLEHRFPELDPYLIAKGVIAAYEGEDNALYPTPMAADNAIRTYIQKIDAQKNQENLKKGLEFLEQNAKKEGVQVTESGLQYLVMEQGSGEKPTAASTVRVHYHGTTIDGEVFDSSVNRGEPAQFPLNGVIKGWTEGLQLMPVGSKYKFFIPSDLAYGPRGQGQQIGPNSALIFEVELLEIIK